MKYLEQLDIWLIDHDFEDRVIAVDIINVEQERIETPYDIPLLKAEKILKEIEAWKV